jgi:single-stranded-DNA-specific exonuclease
VDGFDIGAALAGLEPMLLRTGGHPMAAGLSMEMSRFDEFSAAFKALANAAVGSEPPARTLHIDTEVRLQDIDNRLVTEIARMEPFGMDNPEPLLMAREVLVTLARKVGRDGNHMRFQFMQDGRTVDAIWFGGAETGIREGDLIDVVFNLTADAHTGGPSMKVRDARQSGV